MSDFSPQVIVDAARLLGHILDVKRPQIEAGREMLTTFRLREMGQELGLASLVAELGLDYLINLQLARTEIVVDEAKPEEVALNYGPDLGEWSVAYRVGEMVIPEPALTEWLQAQSAVTPPASRCATDNVDSTPSTTIPQECAGNAGADAGPAPVQPCSIEPWAAAFSQLEPAVQKAYLAYEYAEASNGRPLEDREAYDWLRENGIDENKGNPGQLADYELPDSLETFRRYLSEARKALNKNKYTRRSQRQHRSSIARANEI